MIIKNWRRHYNFILAPSATETKNYEFNLELIENPNNDAYTNKNAIGEIYVGAFLIGGNDGDFLLYKQGMTFTLGNNGLFGLRIAAATIDTGTLAAVDVGLNATITGLSVDFINNSGTNSIKFIGSLDFYIQDTSNAGDVSAP